MYKIFETSIKILKKNYMKSTVYEKNRISKYLNLSGYPWASLLLNALASGVSDITVHTCVRADGGHFEHMMWCDFLRDNNCQSCLFLFFWRLTHFEFPNIVQAYSLREVGILDTFLPARRYASAGNSDRNVSVRLSVCHAPVLCQNEES